MSAELHKQSLKRTDLPAIDKTNLGWKDAVSKALGKQCEIVMPVEPEIVSVPDSSMTVSKMPPVAFTDMTDGRFPKGKVRDGLELFVQNGKAPVNVLTVTQQEESGALHSEYVVVGPEVTAGGTAAMLHHAAPDKSFGIDPDDIIGDYRKIDTQHYKDLERAHATMPGWEHTKREKHTILDILVRNYGGTSSGFKNQDQTDVIVPVLRFTKGDTGLQIITEPPGEELIAGLRAALPDQVTDPERISGGMGLIHLAAYSPDHVEWDKESGYNKTKGNPSNAITGTQVLGYAYRELGRAHDGSLELTPEADIQQSSLLAGYAEYADTGVVPTLPMKGRTEKQLRRDAKRPKQIRNTKYKVASTVMLMSGIAGAATGVYGVAKAGEYGELERKYAATAPTHEDILRAEGTATVLVDLAEAYPHIEPVVAPEIVEQQRIIDAGVKKNVEQAVEADRITAELLTAGGVMLSAYALGESARRVRRNNEWA